MVTAEDCEGYARDCVWYGQQTDDPVLRNRLMALNWRAAAIAMDKRFNAAPVGAMGTAPRLTIRTPGTVT
jgi:hypothetical protein